MKGKILEGLSTVLGIKGMEAVTKTAGNALTDFVANVIRAKEDALRKGLTDCIGVSFEDADKRQFRSYRDETGTEYYCYRGRVFCAIEEVTEQGGITLNVRYPEIPLYMRLKGGDVVFSFERLS